MQLARPTVSGMRGYAVLDAATARRALYDTLRRATWLVHTARTPFQPNDQHADDARSVLYFRQADPIKMRQTYVTRRISVGALTYFYQAEYRLVSRIHCGGHRSAFTKCRVVTETIQTFGAPIASSSLTILSKHELVRASRGARKWHCSTPTAPQ